MNDKKIEGYYNKVIENFNSGKEVLCKKNLQMKLEIHNKCSI